MKRFSRNFPVCRIAVQSICFALFLVLLPVSVSAEPSSCPYDCHLSITYNYLTKDQQKMYDLLYDGLHDGKFSVDVPVHMEHEEAVWLLDYIFNEAPELCAFDPDHTDITCSSDSLSIQLAYKKSLSVQDQFIQDVAALSDGFAGQSDEAGIHSVYEYLIRRFDYGAPAEYGVDVMFAFHALETNRAACNGYAQTMAMLCHFAGYSCSYVDGHIVRADGSTGNHAWNVASINTRPVWLDATWDDEGDHSDDRWYGLDGAAMAADHKPDPEYSQIVYLTSFLPEGADYSVHLDVNNENGYEYGVTTESGTTVLQENLQGEEYYSPALVIYNNGGSDMPVTISYMMDGVRGSWNECTVLPGSNLAFRLNYASQLRDNRGYHWIIWYCNGIRIRGFSWNVE